MRVIKKLLFPVLVLALTVGFGIFGWVNRQSYTDVTSQPDYLSQFAVAEMSERHCVNACSELEATLPEAPLILRVTPVSELVPEFGIFRFRFRVEEVYQGDAVAMGEEIWIASESWDILIEQTGGRYVECGFVNLPQQGREYLVFLSDRIIQDDGRTICFFLEFEMVTQVPMFCYDAIPNTFITPDGVSTYVSYSEVAGNEFFATTQAGLDAMLELKEAMLERYPK